MHKETDGFLKKHVGSNMIQVSGRVPEKLANIVKQKAADFNIEVSTLIRTALAMYVLPELLEQVVNEETQNWLSQEGKERIQFHFGEKCRKYEDIAKFSQFASDETRGLLKEFVNAEVSYMNKIHKKQSERKK